MDLFEGVPLRSSFRISPSFVMLLQRIKSLRLIYFFSRVVRLSMTLSIPNVIGDTSLYAVYKYMLRVNTMTDTISQDEKGKDDGDLGFYGENRKSLRIYRDLWKK